tara:strand:+ start:2092 stop:3909 length:1818 start_codon:yes stop_codon:yes gene_type:complete
MKRFILSFLIASSLPSPILYAQENSDIPEIKPDYNKNEKSDTSKVIWEKLIDSNDTLNRQLIWKKIDDKDQFDLKTTNNKDLYEQIYNHLIEFNLLDLGRSVPTAQTLSQGDIQIKFSQILPFKKAYYGGGTGNQNYEVSINYGLTDSLMMEGFYSHSDDPLQKKITKYDDPVENMWINFGTGITWQAINKNKVLIALNGSIENMIVRSGGCNTYNCNTTSNNIFTNKKEEVENNNLIGSISLPITWRISKKIDFHITPRSIYLPANQSKGSSSGKFYGNSIGIGTGIDYKFYKKLKAFSSIYFPIGTGFNSFDEDLNFSRKPIYNAGIVYSIDTKIALEAGVTNGFGMSPSIGTLTLPSSDELLFKTSLIYRPKNIQLPPKETYKQNRLRLGGLSVSTAEPLKSGEIYANYYINNNGSWGNKIVWGTSERFNFDISLSSIGQDRFSNKPFDGKYHDIDKLFVRGGGKAVFFSQSSGDFITSSARVSAGRLRGIGWLFTELTNTYEFNDNLSLNINPKISYSGVASPTAIGTSLNWQILQDISLIPEYNFALKESTDNWTIALRFSRFENINFDIFTTNSLNFIDTGQFQRSDNQSYGLNVGIVF